MAPSNGSAYASMSMRPKLAWLDCPPLSPVSILFSAKPPVEGYSSTPTDNHPTAPAHITEKAGPAQLEFSRPAPFDYSMERTAAYEVAHPQH